MTEVVYAAASALSRAGQCDLAIALLDAVMDQRGTIAPASLRADLLTAKAFWTSTPVPLPEGAVDVGDAHRTTAWEGAWSRARATYASLVQERLAGEEVDRAAASLLLEDLDALRSSAPDLPLELAVRFHLGLVHENLLGDAANATPHWLAAADSPEAGTAALALRHLGGQAADQGDHLRAQDLWWRSFRLRARQGDVPGALAQLVLLAPSTTLAEATAVWIEEAGFTVLMGGAIPEALSSDSG
jgi:hypothetical protein